LHDRAIHGLTEVDEDTKLVSVGVQSSLATVLPLAVDVGAAGSTSAGNARVLAPEAARVEGIDDATIGLLAVNTGEGSAVNAVVVAGLVKGDVGLATSTSIIVAVGIASLALEDAVTTGEEVGSVTVAVRDSAVVNVAEDERAGVLGARAEEVLAVERDIIGSKDVLAELVVGVEAKSAEVAEGRRAAVRGGSARSGAAGRLTNLAPTVHIFATVARIRVAILVVVDGSIVSADASSLVRASTRTRGATTTLAEDLVELLGVDVVLLGSERLLRPDGAVP
jgi:hypothetical protein